MASFKNLYDQQVGEIFAYGQLTDKTPVSDSNYVNEILASEWLEDLKKEDGLKKLRLKEKEASREFDTMETRRIEAEFATNIKREDARRDLFLNQQSPFLFRKYMLDYWNRLTNGFLESYPTLSDNHKQTILTDCGREVTRIVHQCGIAGCGVGLFDPHAEWVFEIPYDERPKGKNGTALGVDTRYWVKSRFGGPCSSWPGHSGYCWDGTYVDNRTCAHTGGGPLLPCHRQPFKSMLNG